MAQNNTPPQRSRPEIITVFLSRFAIGIRIEEVRIAGASRVRLAHILDSAQPIVHEKCVKIVRALCYFRG